MPGKPVALVCYICGREYGTRSLEIHVKQCKKKWEAEQEQLPKKERRPCPRTPPNFDQYIKSAKAGKIGTKQTAEAMIRYNEQAFQQFDTEALVQCKSCQRTFLPSALKHHAKSCKPGKPLKMRAGLPARQTARAAPQKGPPYLPQQSQNHDLKVAKAVQPFSAGMEESKEQDANFGCKYCGLTLQPGKIFQHESLCPQKPKQQQTRQKQVSDDRKTNWRAKSEAFQLQLKIARKMKFVEQNGGNSEQLNALAAQIPSAPDNRIQCPYCPRKFAPLTAERHIPHCKVMINKPKAPPGKSHFTYKNPQSMRTALQQYPQAAVPSQNRTMGVAPQRQQQVQQREQARKSSYEPALQKPRSNVVNRSEIADLLGGGSMRPAPVYQQASGVRGGQGGVRGDQYSRFN